MHLILQRDNGTTARVLSNTEVRVALLDIGDDVHENEADKDQLITLDDGTVVLPENLHVEVNPEVVYHLLNSVGQPLESISVSWHLKDVQSVRDDLDDEQAFKVLLEARRLHDPAVGINLDVLLEHADALFPKEN